MILSSVMLTTTLAYLLLGLIGITALAGLGREGSAGMTRWVGMLCLIGVGLALLMPTPWHALLLLGVVWNVQRQHPPSSHMNYLETVLTVSGFYLLLIQYNWTRLIEPFLWTLTALGTYMGLWGMYSVLWMKGQKYVHTIGWQPYFQFTIEERDHNRPGAKAGDIWCGQFMTNFTQCVLCLTVASTVGLVVSGWSRWWLLLCLPQMFPLIHYLKIHYGLGQWIVHLLVLVGCVLFIYEPVTAVNLLLISFALLLLYLWKYDRLGADAGGADSGRLVEWKEMWHIWCNSHNWWTYLFGFGIRSWVQVAYDKAIVKAKNTGKRLHNIFTMAHNEYIQQLFEFGTVGLVALVGLSVQVGHTAYNLHKGLWLVMMVMFSVAQLSYPWAFYHRAVVPAIGHQGRSTFHEHRFGSPLLFWISFLLMVLVHG